MPRFPAPTRSHAATRVIRRKKNRWLMIGDHHGPTAGRATVLVRAVDVILGTHKVRRLAGRSRPTGAVVVSVAASA
jgi:hypothetical protein